MNAKNYLSALMAFLMSVAILTPNAVHGGEMVIACEAAKDSSPERLAKMAKLRSEDRGLLWSVSKDGKKSYLYSTVHVAKLEWDYPGPEISKILKKSAKLAVEIDITSKENTAKITEAVEEAHRDEKNDNLSKRISNAFEKICLDESKFSKVSLTAKTSALVLNSARNYGFYPDYAIDGALVGYFRYLNKPIIEIETPKQQAEAISGDSTSAERNIESFESGQAAKIIIRMAYAWESGDLKELAGFFEWCECSETAEEKKEISKLLKDRNPIIAERLTKIYTENSDVFAAIGVLHLVGEDSVISYLESKGFKIERVMF